MKLTVLHVPGDDDHTCRVKIYDAAGNSVPFEFWDMGDPEQGWETVEQRNRDGSLVYTSQGDVAYTSRSNKGDVISYEDGVLTHGQGGNPL